ncbi:MAG: hypothetical protein AB7I13_18375, partial [Vicinamibacterales bacterium]
FTATATAALLALAIACSRQSAAPTSPTAAGGASTNAAADGSTLKVTVPQALAPVNDAQLQDAPTLTISAAAAKYANSLPGPIVYRYQVFNTAGNLVADSGQVSSTSWRVTSALDFRVRHTWRARAEIGSNVGSWSGPASFISSEGGYIRGNEVFDPLFNGTTVGQVNGPVTFTSEGARLDAVSSFVQYVIPITITQGEFAVEIKGLRANASGDKSKVFGMMQGSPQASDYITNPYRVDIQYRGTGGFPPNAITYRVLYGSADDLDVRYEPTTIQRQNSVVNLDPNTWYYWRYTWGRTVRVTVQQGGPTGPYLYDITRQSGNGSYNPQPHYAFIGTPAGRSGIESATIPGTIYRNVWISTRPRP